MVFYEYKKRNNESLSSLLNHYLRNNKSLKKFESSYVLNLDMKDEERRHKLNGINLLKLFEESKLSFSDYLEMVNGNIIELDSLVDGDIVLMDGIKLINTPLYHHAALVYVKF